MDLETLRKDIEATTQKIRKAREIAVYGRTIQRVTYDEYNGDEKFRQDVIDELINARTHAEAIDYRDAAALPDKSRIRPVAKSTIQRVVAEPAAKRARFKRTVVIAETTIDPDVASTPWRVEERGTEEAIKAAPWHHR